MKIKEGYILRQVAGNHIVIAVGEEAINFNGIITINGAGTFLWQQLEKGTTHAELVEAMLKEYDVDADVATKDIDEFLENLRQANLLCE